MITGKLDSFRKNRWMVAQLSRVSKGPIVSKFLDPLRQLRCGGSRVVSAQDFRSTVRVNERLGEAADGSRFVVKAGRISPHVND